jgi:galactose mutarotase-like enzyme
MIILSSQDCRVAIAPERGAIVTSLSVRGREALYLEQASFDDAGRNVRGGIPVLFPLCGPLPGPHYSHAGQSYAMKQHGFARNLPWNVLGQSEDVLSLELRESQQTLEQFPFPFSYRLDYQAVPDGLRIVQRISNRGSEPMPLQFGFHPYFLVGEKERLELDMPVRTYSDNKSAARGDFPGFDFQREEIDWAFPDPQARQASFRDPQRGIEVRVEYGVAYGVLVFWTLKGSPFVCLEPWSSPRLAFPEGREVHRIAPGESLASHVAVGLTVGK